MMSICAIDPHGTAWTTSRVTACNDCILQYRCKYLIFLYMPNGHNKALCVKQERQIYWGKKPRTDGVYKCVSIVRWSKQNSSILIVSRRETYKTPFLMSGCQNEHPTLT